MKKSNHCDDKKKPKKLPYRLTFINFEKQKQSNHWRVHLK